MALKKALPDAARLRSLLTRKGAGESLGFAVSLLAMQGSRFLVSALGARDLGATSYGYWNLFSLVLLYGLYLQLGALNGMGRDVPYFRGKGEAARAEHLVGVAWSVALISGVIGAALILGASLWYAELRAPLQALAVTLLVQVVFQYFQFLLRAQMRFAILNWQQLTVAVALPICYLALRPLGLSGFVLAQCLALGLACAVAAARSGFRPTLTLDLRESWRLIGVGFPIMAAGIFFSLLTTVDRWVILSTLGVEQLGYYTLSILCLSLIGLFPQMITAQMYPRLAWHYGRTNSVAALLRPLMRQIALASAVTLPVVLGAYLLLPTLTQYVLPQYAPGLGAARVLLLGMLCLPVSGAIGNFLNVIGRQWWFMGVQSAGIIVELGAGFGFVSLGWGLTGVALAAVVTYVVTMVAQIAAMRLLVARLAHTPADQG